MMIAVNSQEATPSCRDLTGKAFGKLTVIEYSGRDARSNSIWLCKCECGTIRNFYESKLLLKKCPTRNCGCVNKLPEGRASFNKLYYGYKKDALKRNIVFCLNKEEFEIITKLNCYYCNSEPSQIQGKSDSYNGCLDRVDNEAGYFIGNVVACCKTCNQMKLTLNQYDFFSHLEKILNNMRSK